MPVLIFGLLVGLRCHLVAQHNLFTQTCSTWPLLFLFLVSIESDSVVAKSCPFPPREFASGHVNFLDLLILIHVQMYPS